MERLHGTVLAWHAALADLGMSTGCHDGGGAHITVVLVGHGLTTRHEGQIRATVVHRVRGVRCQTLERREGS